MRSNTFAVVLGFTNVVKKALRLSPASDEGLQRQTHKLCRHPPWARNFGTDGFAGSAVRAKWDTGVKKA